jgi:signal transduction histidine kinase
LASLVALWGFAASITVYSAVHDHYYNQGVTIITRGFASLTAGLPQERAQSYLWLSSDRTTPDAALLAARKLVDEGIPQAKTAMAPAQDQLSDQSRADLNALYTDLAQLGNLRSQVNSGAMSPVGAFQAYTKIIDDQWQFYFAGIKNNGSPFADVSIGSTDMSYALEMGAREAVLVGGALVDRGQMSTAARQQFASAVASRRNLMSVAQALLTPDLGGLYAQVTSSPQYQAFQTMEDEISASPSSGPIPVNPAAWQADSGAYLAGLQKAEMAGGIKLSQLSAALTDRLVTEAVLAAGLGLAAVVASVFLLVWFGRKVTGDLGRLNDSVRAMAEERLPRVVERLRRGDDVDVLAESPPPSTSSVQEISQVAASFGTVQAAAVAAAVEQAGLRKAVNQVFLNISMRNQSLLHRQLGMLDSMERRTTEPDALADLFRLDHLTTRMRRHAEGLIILSGSTPGRGWRDPVRVVDVLRAAVAEVEDYVRVDVTSESDDLVAGNAVNDVIHLVAELVENATIFSPPNTRIEIRAERVGTGLVAEIEDRGLGLSAEELARINERLANTREFDLARSEQLGLFVVSQLAARHDIMISLRRSVYGGTTAVVLLPFGVIVQKEIVQLEEARVSGDEGGWPDDQQTRALTGRHRLLPAPRTTPRAPWDIDPFELPTQETPAPLAPWETGVTIPRSQAGASQRQSSWADEPGSAPASRSPREPGPAPGATVPGPVSSGSHHGMPIRVPQASLAPQLQARRAEAPRPAEREVPEVDSRPPEETRNMLILMQQGWRRGRVDDLDNPQGAPGQGTD